MSNDSLSSLRNQFTRIASAQIKKDYPFLPQRIAVAASMWRRFYERNKYKIETQKD
jgi:hypothetical protein